MSSAEVNRWLQAGINALKAGEREKGRRFLMQVLQVDERNETAWLWLSGAVTAKRERIICLENVLAVNPENRLARKGLQHLGIDPDASLVAESEVELEDFPRQKVRREYQPANVAAAILYPERQVTEWEWHDPTTTQQATDIGYTSETGYDDVWSREADICAYCAQEVTDEETRCPNCRRPLVVRQFRYPKPSTHLHIFWVLLFGLAQIGLLQLIYHVVFTGNVVVAVFNGVLLVLFFGLAVGVYFRQLWAYVGAIALLAILLVMILMTILVPPEAAGRLTTSLDPAIATFVASMAGGLGRFLLIFQATAVVLAFTYAIFFVGSDFDRTEKRQLATIQKGLSTGGDYHAVARRAAQQGMWATAVLHWQRAAAKEPAHFGYQRHLAQGYNQIGFFQRSLDVLHAARRRATHPQKQAEFDRLIRETEQKQTAVAVNVADA